MKQADRELPWPFNKWGCHVLTLARMVEETTKTELSYQDLMYITIEMMATPKLKGFVLDNELTVNGPDELLRSLVRRVAWHEIIRIVQVGADGEYWKWVKEKRVDWTVLKGETVNGNYHFRLGDKDARALYNPDPKVQIARELSIIYYRVTRLV